MFTIDMGIPRCPYDPNKIPKMTLPSKLRMLDDLIYERKVEPRIELKEQPTTNFESLLLTPLKANKNELPIPPQGKHYVIQNKHPEDENDIEYLYNAKTLLFGLMKFVEVQRAILAIILYKISEGKEITALANKIQKGIIMQFINDTPEIISSFKLLCQHVDIYQLYKKFTHKEIPNAPFPFRLFKQSGWVSSELSHTKDKKDPTRAKQIDNVFINARNFRIREPADLLEKFQLKTYDILYEPRFLNDTDTKYEYEDVLLKKANQSLPVIEMSAAGVYSTMLTPLPRLQPTIYLFSDTISREYEPVLLKCQVTKPPPKYTLRQYIEKEQRLIVNTNYEIRKLCLRIQELRTQRNIKNIQNISLLQIGANTLSMSSFNKIIQLDNTGIRMTDYPSWLIQNLVK